MINYNDNDNFIGLGGNPQNNSCCVNNDSRNYKNLHSTSDYPTPKCLIPGNNKYRDVGVGIPKNMYNDLHGGCGIGNTRDMFEGNGMYGGTPQRVAKGRDSFLDRDSFSDSLGGGDIYEPNYKLGYGQRNHFYQPPTIKKKKNTNNESKRNNKIKAEKSKVKKKNKSKSKRKVSEWNKFVSDYSKKGITNMATLAKQYKKEKNIRL